MSNYTFHSLSPHDFELLVRDLLQAELNLHIESFKSGRDQGVDLRYARSDGGKCIIQCKHYANSKTSNLVHSFRHTESPKIAKLNPSRYIIVTSLDLSPSEKNKIIAAVDSVSLQTSDIYSRSDLNNLIAKHPNIERQHYKLWLSSVPILQAILNSEIILRSTLTIEDIRLRLSLFVPGPPVQRCQELLKENGYCLISGAPGIGKTTTAEIVAAIHIEKGWDCIAINATAGEAFRQYRPEKRQLFYYDDFLGQTSLNDKLAKNEEIDLTRIITSCSRNSSTKRFLLTTREYLLAQAKQNYEKLDHSDLDLSKCVVELKDYTPRLRAKMLVNHLFFFGVPQDTCRRFIDSKMAHKIVNHSNYSPRIVEYMCISKRLRDLPASDFADSFVKNMDNPHRIWSHAYYNQLSPTAQSLFICLLTTGDMTDKDCLSESYQWLLRDQETVIQKSRKFRQGLAELEGTFIRIGVTGKKTSISFHSPSVRDFGNSLFEHNSELAESLLLHSRFAKQITYCLQYVRDEFLLQNSDKILQLMKSTLQAQGPNLIGTSHNQLVIFTPPICSTLVSWIERIDQVSATLRTFIMSIAIDVLSSSNIARDGSTRQAIQLYNIVVSIDVNEDCPSVPSVRDFVVQLTNSATTVDDYELLVELMEEHSGAEEWWQYDALVEHLGDSMSWAASLELENIESYSELKTTIESYEGLIESIGLSTDIIDLAEASNRLDRLGEAEDHWAEMYEEDMAERRYERRLLEEDVDSILDSIR